MTPNLLTPNVALLALALDHADVLCFLILETSQYPVLNRTALYGGHRVYCIFGNNVRGPHACQ
jgi:hypothetical protein